MRIRHGLALLFAGWLGLFGCGLALAMPGSPTVFEPAKAPHGVPLIRNFSQAAYAAGSQNWAVVQDHRGVIYVGNSADGVLQFDGNHWNRIPIPDRSVVRSLAVDESGRVFVGCVGSFGYLAPDKLGRMRYVSLLENIDPTLRGFADVWRALPSSKGVYFLTDSTIFRFSHGRVDAWKTKTSFHLAFVVRDRLYVRETDVGLEELVDGKLRIVAGGKRFATEKIYVLLPWSDPGSGKQGLLIGTRKNGWFTFDGSQYSPWLTDATVALAHDQIYGGLWLDNGALAVGTLQGGVFLFDRQGRQTGHFRRSDGLINDTVFAMYEDREHGLWLALDNGVARINIASPLTYFSPNSGLDGAVLSIGQFGGSLYAGTTKGLFQLHANDDGNAHFSRVKGLEGQTWSILDTGESLLVGNSYGIYVVNGTDSKPVSTGDATAFIMLRRHAQPSVIYVGSDQGVLLLQRDGSHWKNAGKLPGISSQVRTMADGSGRHIWLVSEDRGVLRVTLPGDGNGTASAAPVVEHFAIPQAASARLDEVFIYRINNELRFFTSTGVYRFDGNLEKFVVDTHYAKLFSDGPRLMSLLHEDGQGRLWSSMADENDTFELAGAAIADTQGNYHWDGRPMEAIAGMEVSALHVDADGVVWVGTDDGIYRLDSTVPTHYTKPLPVLLSKVSDRAGSLLWGGSGKAVPTSLVWGDNGLRFEYSSPEFRTSAPARFRVLLEGVDTQWSSWSEESYRDYTNLHEGDYLFRVQARDADGNLSDEATYDFTVLPPWYRSWWAYLAYFWFAAGVVVWGGGVRSRRLAKRNAELAKLVALRTQELSDSHQELHRVNTALMDLSITDALTGLKNRRYVFDHVLQDVAAVQREYAVLSLDTAPAGNVNIDLLFLMIDIDHFKEVNDRFGHAAGDRLLAQFRGILDAAIRESDTPVRWGGEEFLVIARFTNSDFAKVVAERIRAMVEQHVFDLGDGQTIRRTCSIGFAIYPVFNWAPQRFNWEDAVCIADQCLYMAKRTGRNRWIGARCTEKVASSEASAILQVNLDVLVSDGYLHLMGTVPASRESTESVT